MTRVGRLKATLHINEVLCKQMRRCDLLAICVLCTKLQCRMQPSVKLTGVATATAPHCNKAVNLKAEPPTRPDSQPTGTSGEPECPTGPHLKQMNWGEEHSLWALGLSNHSHHMPPGGVREQGKRGGRGGASAPKYEPIPQHLSPGFTDNCNQQTRTHTLPVSQDHRNSICPEQISPLQRKHPSPLLSLSTLTPRQPFLKATNNN